jgi:tetratricopeptide (TPR) repeat protein/transcriptional regulator with XRE-family HTH domain
LARPERARDGNVVVAVEGGGRPSETVAALLKRFRLVAGLSQEDLAERARLSVQAIGAIERGARRRPHPRTLRALAAGLALSAEDRALLLGTASRPQEPGAYRASTRSVAQLPRDIGDFTGRESEVSQVVAALTSPPANAQAAPVVAISGTPGVGKSALAVHVAQRVRSRFPDGQLYVNLQGASTGLPPLTPLEALGRLVRSFGLDPAAIPSEVEEAAALFRSLAAERRLLVLLDNARGAEQVRPLLPGSPTCAVLVTSRQVLATVEGAQALHLDVLPPEPALELLGRVAGPHRIAAEPQPAGEVVRWCGQLPLAIRIAGARLAARPGWPIRELAGHLGDATLRLEALRAGELAVRASFDVSLQALEESSDAVDQAAAAAFVLLSVPDGPDLGSVAAARLLDRPETATEAVLERLLDAHLLESHSPARYQFHHLVHLYAREHAAGRLPEAERMAALARVTGFYTATAWGTMALLRPGEERLATADQRWTAGGLAFEDAARALSWLEAERSNVVAAVTRAATAATTDPERFPPELPGQLAQSLFGLLEAGSWWHDWVQVNEAALRVARASRDRAAEAVAHDDLGAAYLRLGRYAEAIDRLRRGIAIHRELCDQRGEAVGLSSLGVTYERLGRYEEAAACLHESLAIFRAVGDRRGQAGSLSNLGLAQGRSRSDEAIAHVRESLAINLELGDRRGQARNLNNLGMIHAHMERYERAIGSLEESLAICRELGHREGQVENLHSIGMVNGRLGRHDDAIACQRASLALSRELGALRSQAVALRDLGDALEAVDRAGEAREAWREALTICQMLQLPEQDQIATRLGDVAGTR